ncbi:hypothetical protein [Flavobacterium sp.]|uniref:hypothetical protein n=1 Tax=Flavobacterium sp. TaxID=239 RepID=UPI00404748B8
MLLINLLSISCQNKNERVTNSKQDQKSDNIENVISESNKNNMSIETILKLQLLAGKSGLFDATADGETYMFEEKDLQAIIPSLKSMLIGSGFNFLSNDSFNQKIKSVFGRTIDTKSESKYLYITPWNNCNRKLVFYTNDNTIEINPNSYYIIKNENFITELYAIPQIIDYQKEYPKIAAIENNIETDIVKNNTKVHLYLWKEFETEKVPEYNLKIQRKKNIQTLVARNMYLFNDSKAHFKWLILNDEYFMRSLVTTFGYYDDTELNKWVADNTEFNKENIHEINTIIYNRKCDGKIGFNYTFLKIIAEDQEKANEMYSFFKYNYFNWLLDNKNNSELTFSQKAEILARLHNFIFSNMDDYRVYEFMGSFAEWYDYDNTYSKEFKAKNYYNIPNFEKQWKEAKLEGDGVSLPGEE